MTQEFLQCASYCFLYFLSIVWSSTNFQWKLLPISQISQRCPFQHITDNTTHSVFCNCRSPDVDNDGQMLQGLATNWQNNCKHECKCEWFIFWFSTMHIKLEFKSVGGVLEWGECTTSNILFFIVWQSLSTLEIWLIHQDKENLPTFLINPHKCSRGHRISSG